MPGVRAGDTVSYSFDNQPGPVIVMSVVADSDNIRFNFFNPQPNDYTVSGVTVYFEIFPKG